MSFPPDVQALLEAQAKQAALASLAAQATPQNLTWEKLPINLQHCRECKSQTVPRWHEGAGMTQWFCSNPDCWLSK